MKLSLAVALLVAAETTKCAAFTTTIPNSGRPTFVAHRLDREQVRLFGLLDEINSDQYNLLSKPSSSSSSGAGLDATNIKLNDAYEVFLAELVFSTNDPRLDIVNNFERATDDDFLAFLANKIDTSKDLDERLALRDLLSIIQDIKKRAELSAQAEERARREAEEAEQQRLAELQAQADAGAKMSNADVLRKAAAIGTANVAAAAELEKESKKNVYDLDLTPEIRLSYQDLLNNVLPPYKPGDTAATVVFKYYDQFDAQFLKILSECSTNGDTDAQAVLDALSVEQNKRMAAASDALKQVLAQGEPMRMEGALVRLAREGRIDEPFLLLLEANATQARDAGATGPAQLMERLRKRALEEKDKQASSKEIRLIRQLLRTSDPTERDQILTDAFTPRESLIVPGTSENARRALDGERPEDSKPLPDVPPPDFINACKAVLLNFGNLETTDDRGDLASRIKQLAAEAEVVATRIYGQTMSVREYQDRMWKEQTTSIFDLERMEIEAERMGTRAPWTNPDASDDMFPGFDKDGRMQIGGM